MTSTIEAPHATAPTLDGLRSAALELVNFCNSFPQEPPTDLKALADHPGDIGIREMLAFLAVVEHRTVTAAAQSLGYSQPGLSRVIGRIELFVGEKLFTRAGSEMKLTTSGLPFLEWCRSTVKAFTELGFNLNR